MRTSICTLDTVWKMWGESLLEIKAHDLIPTPTRQEYETQNTK